MTLAYAAEPEYFTVGAVPSGATFFYSGVLVQLDGVTPIQAGMLQSLTLTFVDEDTGVVINGRDAQNVFNQGNGVTVDNTGGTGVLQWTGSAADNPFVRIDPPPKKGDVERHEATFQWTWQQGGVTYPGKRKVFVVVESYQNLDVTPGGGGTVQLTDTVFGPDTVTPVDDALVWVTSDSAGTTLVAGPQRTTPTGQFSFMLAHGTYYVWVNSPSFNPSGGALYTI